MPICKLRTGNRKDIWTTSLINKVKGDRKGKGTMKSQEKSEKEKGVSFNNPLKDRKTGKERKRSLMRGRSTEKGARELKRSNGGESVKSESSEETLKHSSNEVGVMFSGKTG